MDVSITKTRGLSQAGNLVVPMGLGSLWTSSIQVLIDSNLEPWILWETARPCEQADFVVD